MYLFSFLFACITTAPVDCFIKDPGSFCFNIGLDTMVKKREAVTKTDNPLTSDLDKKVDSATRLYLVGNNISNLAIGILHADKAITYGYARVDSNNLSIPSSKSLFEIGSITKTFTATLLAEFILKGNVKADDPVNLYLPDSIPALQYNGKAITLKHLVNHTAGLPRLPINIFLNANSSDPYSSYTNEKLFYWLKSFQLNKEPGKVYEYSNLGVGLLGVILERIAGKSFESLLLDNICKPLKMKYTMQHNVTGGLVQGFDASGKRAEPWSFQALTAAGGIRSCITDMLLYAKAQVNKNRYLLSEAIQLTHQTTFKNGDTEVAMGWHAFSIHQNEYLAHEGQTGGYNSIMIFNTNTGNAVVILVNSAVSAGKLGIQIINWLDNKQ